MNLGFLNKVVVKGEVKVSQRSLKDKAPAAGSDLRVYHTGAVYPSEEFAKLFNLEYQPKIEVEGKGLVYGENPGMGLDIFRSSDYASIESEQPFLVIAAVSRKQGKIDVFRGCEYDMEGKPKSSVFTQGATSFGKEELISMLEEMYNVTLDKDTKPYVDLKVVGSGDGLDMPWVNLNGSAVYHVPKKVSRGKLKGETSYVRREHLLLWALVPTEWTEGADIKLSGTVYNEEALKAENDEVDAPDDVDQSGEEFNPDMLSDGPLMSDGRLIGEPLERAAVVE